MVRVREGEDNERRCCVRDFRKMSDNKRVVAFKTKCGAEPKHGAKTRNGRCACVRWGCTTDPKDTDCVDGPILAEHGVECGNGGRIREIREFERCHASVLHCCSEGEARGACGVQLDVG